MHRRLLLASFRCSQGALGSGREVALGDARLRRRRVGDLRGWPGEAGAAVQEVLATSWSNTRAEGQISRLKILKRTMYGRASFALRRRVLLAA